MPTRSELAKVTEPIFERLLRETLEELFQQSMSALRLDADDELEQMFVEELYDSRASDDFGVRVLDKLEEYIQAVE